jgi:hypothetical protein
METTRSQRGPASAAEQAADTARQRGKEVTQCNASGTTAVALAHRPRRAPAQRTSPPGPVPRPHRWRDRRRHHAALRLGVQAREDADTRAVKVIRRARRLGLGWDDIAAAQLRAWRGGRRWGWGLPTPGPLPDPVARPARAVGGAALQIRGRRHVITTNLASLATPVGTDQTQQQSTGVASSYSFRQVLVPTGNYAACPRCPLALSPTRTRPTPAARGTAGVVQRPPRQRCRTPAPGRGPPRRRPTTSSPKITKSGCRARTGSYCSCGRTC